jgi:hypothetical protein
VLLACAQDGQTRPGLAASADLLRSALLTRLRPAGPRPRAVYAGVRLMYLGALAELATWLTVMATAGTIRATVLHYYPNLTTAAWHAVVLHLTVDEIGAPVVAAIWLWMAWANARGRDWARPVFMSLFFLTTVGLLIALGEDSVRYAPAALIAGAVTWIIGLAAMLCIFSRQAGPYYERRPAAASTTG